MGAQSRHHGAEIPRFMGDLELIIKLLDEDIKSPKSAERLILKYSIFGNFCIIFRLQLLPLLIIWPLA